VRDELPGLLRDYGVKTFLDAPCGDWRWMQEVDLTGIDYIGADISLELIEDVRTRFARPGLRFEHLDVTSDSLPKADLMMCRDCLFHLKNRFRWGFFRNFAASEIPYLLMTMHHLQGNRPLGEVGRFSAFSPMAEPFNFPAPLAMVHEGFDDLPQDWSKIEKPWHYKSMGLWTRDHVIGVLEQAEAAA